jgi:hypothetical protein
MGIEAISIFSIALIISPEIGGWTLAPVLFFYGIGVGLATAQLTSVILGEVPTADSGQASGMQSTFRQVGSALGIAIVGTVLAVSLGSITEARLADVPGLPPAAREGIAEAVSSSAGQVLPTFREQPGAEAVVAVVEDSFSASASRAAIVASLFVLIGFALSFRIPDLDLYSEQSQQSAD